MSSAFDGRESLLASPTTTAASGTLTLADVKRWFDLMRSEPLQPDIQVMSPWLYDHYDEIQEAIRKESQERLRRYRKYQRRKAWGLAHKKRHRRRHR